MCPDYRAVDHHVFIVVISGQITKDPLDDTAFTPAAQTPVHVFPVPETGRKITPWNAGTVAIQHGFHEQTIVRSRAANMTFTTRKKVLYPLPLVVAQTITAHSSVSLKTGKTDIIKRQKVQPSGVTLRA
jgi:hypothetical protein